MRPRANVKSQRGACKAQQHAPSRCVPGGEDHRQPCCGHATSPGAPAGEGQAAGGAGAPAALAGGGHFPQCLIAADGQNVLGVVDAKQAAQVPGGSGVAVGWAWGA